MSQQLDSGPSIVDLFYSAKKLLSLQPRIANRQLRKDNFKSQQQQHPQSAGTKPSNIQNQDSFQQHQHQDSLQQHQHQDSLQQHQHQLHDNQISATVSNVSRSPHSPNNKVLDLLSPLSIDDLKSSPPALLKSSTTSTTNTTAPSQRMAVVASKQTLNTELAAKSINTPSSIHDDSSPTHSEDPKTFKSSRSSIPKDYQSNLTSGLKSKPPIPAPLVKQGPPSAATSPGKPTECFNCQTLKTPLWRKDPLGNTLCNACGLFFKLHGTTRPMSLKSDVIKKRSSRRSSAAINPKGTSSTSLSSLPNSFTRNIAVMPESARITSSSNGSYPNTSNSYSYAPSTSLPTSQSSCNPGIAPSSSRFKNVLILPKPTGNTITPNSTTPLSTTPNTPNSFGIKSIPIPSSYNIGSTMNSPASPLTSSNNQQFKRKKSEVNIAANQDYYDINNPSSSFGQRLSSSSALSNSLGNGVNGGISIGLSNSKRNSTSFQPTSLNRRTSLTNLPGASQRKNSNFSSGTPTNSFAFANNNSNYTPTNSLTSSNINILNQRFTNMKTSYFDNPPLSRHNSITTINQNLISTPGSHTSLSGMISQRHPSYANIPSEYFRPSKAGNESDTSSSVPVTPLNVTDLLPSSGKGTGRHNSSSSNESMDAPADNPMGRTQDDDQLVDMMHNTRDVEMDMGIDVHKNDFFENYTSIQTTEDFVIPSKMCNSMVGSHHKPGKSSLTDGLKNLASSKSNNKNDSTDLDWLKFEL